MRRVVSTVIASFTAVFALSGCMWEFGLGAGGPTGPTTQPWVFSGTVWGTPVNGNFTASLSAGSSCPMGAGWIGTVTLSDATGTVSKHESLCTTTSTDPSRAVLVGEYTVDGGTG